MIDATTLSSIQSILSITMYVVGIVGIPIGVYKMYDLNREKDGTKITDTEKVDIGLGNKIEVLDTKLTSKIDNMHTEMNLKFQAVNDWMANIKQNDLHSIFEKMRDHDDEMNKFRSAVTQLSTIIDERVPRKTVDKIV